MQSRTERKLLSTLLIALFIGLATYRVLHPLPYTIPAIALITALTAAILIDIESIRLLNPHEINLAQKKTYRITLPSVLSTTLLAGLITALLLLATGEILQQVTAFAGYTPLSTQLALQAIERLSTFTAVDTAFTAYLVVGIATGIGFWLLYPYIPIQNEELAAPLTFVITSAYLLLILALLTPTTLPNPYHLVLDGAIIAVWGKIFAVIYESVEHYVP